MLASRRHDKHPSKTQQNRGAARPISSSIARKSFPALKSAVQNRAALLCLILHAAFVVAGLGRQMTQLPAAAEVVVGLHWRRYRLRATVWLIRRIIEVLAIDRRWYLARLTSLDNVTLTLPDTFSSQQAFEIAGLFQ
jgi:hypothetical protein